MEGVDWGWEAHDRTNGVVKSATLGVGASSPVVLLTRMDWKETHLGSVKTAAGAGPVECKSTSTVAGQNLALEEVVVAGRRFPVQNSNIGLGVVIRSGEVHDCHSDAHMAAEGEEAAGMVVEETLRWNSFVRSDPHSSAEMSLLDKRLGHMVDGLS